VTETVTYWCSRPSTSRKPVRFNGTPQLLFFRIEQCLAKPPESRPSADSLLADLDRLANPVANLPGLQDLQRCQVSRAWRTL
jgi:hypothetical protein